MDNLRSSPLRGRSSHKTRARRISLNHNKLVTKLFECFRTERNEIHSSGRDGLLSEDPLSFSIKYLEEKILSKYSDGTTNENLRNVAFEKWFRAEDKCTEINKRFSNNNGLYGPWTREINLARNIIWNLLGPFVDLAEVSKHFNFGPGASTRLKRKRGDSSFKFSGNPETTYLNIHFANAALSSIPIWKYGPFRDNDKDLTALTLVIGSNIDTVPKNSKEDRVICIEPCMNMYIQKGFGAVIRQRLLKVGIDLNNQENNQNGALKAYDSGLSTIDLSQASDTISIGLVQQLLPPDWFDKLNICRSHDVVLPSGQVHHLQKFSSMGNGFTFELESLIFWSLCESVRLLHTPEGHHVLVYGDDLIIDRRQAPTTIELLDFCGFTTNQDKSFIDGDFFESCGKHFFRKHDVSPFFIRRPIDNIFELFLVHNNIYRWLSRNIFILEDFQIKNIWNLLRFLRSQAPSKERKCEIPDGFGDNGFVLPLPDLLLRFKRGNKSGWEVLTVRQCVLKAELLIHDNPTGLTIKGLRRIGSLDEASVYPTHTDTRYFLSTLKLHLRDLSIEVHESVIHQSIRKENLCKA